MRLRDRRVTVGLTESLDAAVSDLARRHDESKPQILRWLIERGYFYVTGQKVPEIAEK